MFWQLNLRAAAWILLLAVSASGRAVVVDLENGEAIFIEHHEVSIRLDGALDEEVWQNLDAWDEFVVTDPDSLQKPAHTTLIRIFHSEKGLYVGAEMHQPVETLIQRLSGRDQRWINRESINITLDTSGEGRYGYWFGINLGGSLSDGTVLPERQFSNDWDGAWRGASKQTESGWTAEFFIPWSIMSMPVLDGGERRFGLYMSRKVAYLDERWGWPALPGTLPKFMSVLQTMNMQGVNPKMEYSVYPFASAAYSRVDNEAINRIGADIFWRPSTSFQLTTTLNPDFGIVESDNVVVNLSATEVFFPEKRLFFLEGQDVFIASPRARGDGSPTTLINTRRIGGPGRKPDLDGITINEVDDIAPADLLFAGKATGQFGKYRYGALGALEDDLEYRAEYDDTGESLRLKRDGSRYGAFRLSREGGKNGDYRAVGLLATAVQHFDGDAYTVGFDSHYLTPNGKFKYDSQWFASNVDDEDDGFGGFVDLEYTFRRGVKQRFGFTWYDENVDINDLGFLGRNDVIQLRTAHTRTTSNISWARDNRFDIRGFAQKNKEGLFTGAGVFVENRTNFHNLSRLRLRIGWRSKYFDDLNSFDNGAFRINERLDGSIQFDSNDTRKLSYAMSLGGGEEKVDGNIIWGWSELRWQPNDRFTLNVSAGMNDRDGWLLHQEDENMTSFASRQRDMQFSVEYFFSARQQIRASVQWVAIRAKENAFYRISPEPDDLIRVEKPPGPSDDFAISNIAFQLRYRWELAPLSDLFVVYTKQGDQDLDLDRVSFPDLASQAWNDPLIDLLVVKLRYRFGS